MANILNLIIIIYWRHNGVSRLFVTLCILAVCKESRVQLFLAHPVYRTSYAVRSAITATCDFLA